MLYPAIEGERALVVADIITLGQRESDTLDHTFGLEFTHLPSHLIITY